jgi:hypothetical protein
MIPAPRTATAAPSNSRTISALAGLLFALTSLLALIFAADVCMLLVSGKGAERRDFISYWVAGQQLGHHQDPYDASATLRLERELGFPPGGEALIVRNPPTALLLVAPLGYINFRAAAFVWSLLLLGCWLVSIRMLSTMYCRLQTRYRVFGYSISPTFTVALFAPALACIFYGQTALFALLGLVLFLRLHRTRPFLAGMALWLCALKPHLFLPFAIVLLLWIVAARAYRVLLGAAIALGASLFAAYLLDPIAWHQYDRMLHTAGLDREFIPCIGIALRFAIGPNATWLQYLPAAAACIWAAVYYLRRRDTWDWNEDGPLLALVSMFAAPYAWVTDQALAVPALLLVASRSSFRAILVLALLSSVVEGAILANVTMHSVFYVWTAPAWLAWYLIAARKAGVSPRHGLTR